ncbi:MAG TPA: hypothetical protein ENJ56_02800 [Anaerolineae bacterium]|nr:hypothetical protein [Anaerolineae bacterium]
MNEERAFTLMMDALEGVLEPLESAELTTYLSDNPALADEWEMLQTVDHLLRVAPPSPLPPNFAVNTLRNLPNPRIRRIFISAFYILLLLGGLLPVALFLIFRTQLDSQSMIESVQLLQTVGTSLLSIMGATINAQPGVLGWLTLMLSAIFVWSTVFRQYSIEASPILVN